MKFIRDIIGEKRDMDAASGEAVMNGAKAEPALKPSADAPVDAAPPQAEPVSAPAPQVDPAPVMPDADVADDIAAFFAKEQSQQDPVAAPQVTASAPQTRERKPTKLILGTPQRTDVAAAPAQEDATPQAEAELPSDLDRVLVSEHTVDPALHDILKGADPIAPSVTQPEVTPAAPEPAAPEAAAEPAPAPMHQAAPEASIPPVMPPVAAPAAPRPAMAQSPEHVEVPKPAVGRGAGSHGRVKTRLLGFNASMDADVDPMTANEEANAASSTQFPVGWLMVVEGEGRGSAFTLFHGVSTIGRGSDQTVRLDFGDNSISRENHASVAYDPRQKSFFIGHGGKANIVRRNDRPVLSTEELSLGDTITIGETTLRFVPCCGPDFSWEDGQETGRAHAPRI